jgi:hypothetical protein
MCQPRQALEDLRAMAVFAVDNKAEATSRGYAPELDKKSAGA